MMSAGVQKLSHNSMWGHSTEPIQKTNINIDPTAMEDINNATQ